MTQTSLLRPTWSFLMPPMLIPLNVFVSISFVQNSNFLHHLYAVFSSLNCGIFVFIHVISRCSIKRCCWTGGRCDRAYPSNCTALAYRRTLPIITTAAFFLYTYIYITHPLKEWKQIFSRKKIFLVFFFYIA